MPTSQGALPQRNDGDFVRFWQLGYQRLCPIIPPGAPISDRSYLAGRIAAGNDDRGKVPGIKWPDGQWTGLKDWLKQESTEADLAHWAAMGAGVGIKTGEIGDGHSLLLIDADTIDVDRAAVIKKELEARLGPLPVRIGREPKAGYLVRVPGTFKYTRILFGSKDEHGGVERVEILSDGKQFVADGIHPKTMKPYAWPQGVPELAAVPIVQPEALLALLEALRPLLPEARGVEVSGERAADQDRLRGDPELVAKAVRATPNTTDLFPDRNAMVKYGAAIRAALPGDDGLARELFLEWAERWEDPPLAEPDPRWPDRPLVLDSNDPEWVAAEWDRIRAPFSVGAGWVYELAERNSGGAFNRWLEPETYCEPLFGPNFFETGGIDTSASPQTVLAEAAAAFRLTPYRFPDPGAIPKREWLYGGHYIRDFVSTTVAPSGVGKSSLNIAEALAMASGKPLLGVKPHGCFRVSIYNAEDPLEELERRVAACMMLHGLTAEDVGDRLLVNSGRDQPLVIAHETREGAVIRRPLVGALVAEIERWKIDVMTFDPFVSSHAVSENDNGAIDMVTKEWSRVAGVTHSSIELVHHVRKLNGSEITVEDMRGAVALLATSRSARALAKMTKAEAVRAGLDEGAGRRLFRFADAKNNLALPGDVDGDWFELASIGLGNGAGEGLERVLSGDSVGAVRKWVAPERSASLASDERGEVLRLVREGEWRRDPRAGDAWVGQAVAQALHLDLYDDGDKAKVKAMIAEWIKSGVLKEVTKPDAQRKKRAFVEVADSLIEAPEADKMSGSAFD